MGVVEIAARLTSGHGVTVLEQLTPAAAAEIEDCTMDTIIWRIYEGTVGGAESGGKGTKAVAYFPRLAHLNANGPRFTAFGLK